MRAVIVPLALCGLIGLAVPAHAAPVVPHDLVIGVSPITTLVRQRCGAGMRRDERGWQDKHGAWHGNCVSKRSSAAAATGRAGSSTADALNAQELARVQGAAPR